MPRNGPPPAFHLYSHQREGPAMWQIVSYKLSYRYNILSAGNWLPSSQMADVFYINVSGAFKQHQVKVVREDVDMHFEKFTVHGKNKVVLKSNQK